MKLVVATPLSVVVEADGVRAVRAEDGTGAFGILPGHADFVTVLAISVLSWRDGADRQHHVALRGGVLTVRGGDRVEVATRDAVGEDTFTALGRAVLARFRDEARAEEEARVSSQRLHLAAIRQLQRYLESGHRPVPLAAAPGFTGEGPPRGDRA